MRCGLSALAGQCKAPVNARNTINRDAHCRFAAGGKKRTSVSYAGNAGVSKACKALISASEALPRFSTGFKEFDRARRRRGAGKRDSIGGKPPARASRRCCCKPCKLSEGMKTLYVTGEESLQQVAMRAHRLGLPTANLEYAVRNQH